MLAPIVYIDHSEVVEGKLGELEPAIEQLVRRVKAERLRYLSYDVYLSEDRARMTVMHAHPDSASLELLMGVIAPLLPPFKAFIRLRSIDVYGSPSDVVLEQLRRKAETLGGATLTIHEPFAQLPQPD